MNVTRLIVGAALTFLICSQADAKKQTQDSAHHDVSIARKKVYPALVNITVVMRFFNAGKAQRQPGGGSGVIVTPQGHVLTNYHVAGNTTRIVCTLPSGEAIEASVITHDPATDLSVLKLHLEKRSNPKAPIPYAKLGDSASLQVGDPVISMGNPMMLSSSLTVGVVSNTKRVFTDFTGTEIQDRELVEDERTGMFTRWIQHDALIQPGNSGGPLVNLKGEVVGINELGGGGIGFAIPSNTAVRVLKQALAYGKVKRGWIGISVLPVSKLERKTGALVSAVAPNSPAANSGIKPGDILLAMNGSPITVRFFEEVPVLYQRIADIAAGTELAIRYTRNGDWKTAHVVVVPMRRTSGDEEEFRAEGITARNITESMAITHMLPTTKGVLVTGVRTGYPFDTAVPKVSEGDVITSVGDIETIDLASFARAIARLRKDETAVAFRREEESLVTAIKRMEDRLAEEGTELPKAWIGVKTQVLSPEVSKALKMNGTKGFRITEVFPWTEASKAGLMQGDIITSLNGTALEAQRQQDADDLKRAVEDLDVGASAELGILRRGASKTIKLKLEGTPSSAPQAKKRKQEEFEFMVRDVTVMDRMEHHWTKDQPGVLVADVTMGGWAQMAGLRVDDLVLGIRSRRISNLDSFAAVMSDTMKRRPKVIDIFIRRGVQTHFVFIEPDWAKLTNGR